MRPPHDLQTRGELERDGTCRDLATGTESIRDGPLRNPEHTAPLEGCKCGVATAADAVRRAGGRPFVKRLGVRRGTRRGPARPLGFGLFEGGMCSSVGERWWRGRSVLHRPRPTYLIPSFRSGWHARRLRRFGPELGGDDLGPNAMPLDRETVATLDPLERSADVPVAGSGDLPGGGGREVGPCLVEPAEFRGGQAAEVPGPRILTASLDHLGEFVVGPRRVTRMLGVDTSAIDVTAALVDGQRPGGRGCPQAPCPRRDPMAFGPNPRLREHHHPTPRAADQRPAPAAWRWMKSTTGPGSSSPCG